MKVVIPETIYMKFGRKVQEGSDIRLGFGTYKENNSAFEKRKATINAWHSTGKTEDLDNTPRDGFSVSNFVTHGGGWNDLTVHWRVRDPRGFELEISSGNLNKVLHYCTLKNGVIQGKCVWGWDKGNRSHPVIIPIDSDLYETCKKSSEIHFASRLKSDQLPIGSTVTHRNGDVGIYLDKLYVLVRNDQVDNDYQNRKTKTNFSVREMFGVLNTKTNSVKMEVKTDFIKVESDDLFHLDFHDICEKCNFSHNLGRKNVRTDVLKVSHKKFDLDSIKLEEIGFDDFRQEAYEITKKLIERLPDNPNHEETVYGFEYKINAELTKHFPLVCLNKHVLEIYDMIVKKPSTGSYARSKKDDLLKEYSAMPSNFLMSAVVIREKFESISETEFSQSRDVYWDARNRNMIGLNESSTINIVRLPKMIFRD